MQKDTYDKSKAGSTVKTKLRDCAYLGCRSYGSLAADGDLAMWLATRLAGRACPCMPRVPGGGLAAALPNIHPLKTQSIQYKAVSTLNIVLRFDI